MGSDDFIDLDSSCASDRRCDDNSLKVSNFVPTEADCQNGTALMTEDIPDVENIKTLNGDNERGVEYLDALDPDIDSSKKHPILEESTKLVEPMVALEKVNDDEPVQDLENSCLIGQRNAIVGSSLIDGSPIAGVKRARVTCAHQEPSVRVVYNSLTRESKKKLMELMQQWSEWHAQHQPSSKVSSKEDLEFGEETYFPALHVGLEKASAVSFWIDNKARKEETKNIQLDNDLVPLYDRGCTLASTSLDGSVNPESWIESLEASRCFNCASYNHSLKECPKPRDNVAISNARKQHNAKRNQGAGSRGQARYYQKTPGKFDDLKAGVLGAETRESLGIGEFDPPPWLHRMREMGYPPGYLDVVEDEDQPSGITIFAAEELKEEYEEGELPEKGEPVLPEKKMTVEFPGLNSPIPENADHRRWATPLRYSGSSSFNSHSNPRSNHSSETRRGHHHDHRRTSDYRDDGPPGSEHGLAASFPGYSPRYSPYEHNTIPRSPSLGKSLSDRGWRSPVTYESSPGHSPHSPYPYHSGMAWQSPRCPSPSRSLEHWNNHESSYGASPDVSSQNVRDMHEHRRRHSRR